MRLAFTSSLMMIQTSHSTYHQHIIRVCVMNMLVYGKTVGVSSEENFPKHALFLTCKASQNEKKRTQSFLFIFTAVDFILNKLDSIERNIMISSLI